MPKNILENVWDRYNKAGKVLKFEDRLMQELVSFKMRLSFDLDATVRGKPRRLKAVRVWHRGPLTDCVFKGGNRYRHGITMGALESHAAEMSPKCWIHELPYGGAKGGIDVDPNQCTSEELEEITYKFVDELNERNAIGPFRDVPAPDMGTNPLIMFWMSQRYSYLHRGEPFVKAVVTGKPVKLQNAYIGGIHGRIEATGYGLQIALSELRKPAYRLFSLPPKPTAIIQGFGNVGANFASLAKFFGLKITAVADEFGGVFNGDGLDIPALVAHARSHRPATVKNFPAGEDLSPADFFEIPCDILVPAATEEVITSANVNRIRAKVILEGANGPTTPEADEILNDRGLTVIPDIYANSGGVVVSFFEWAKNINLSDQRIPIKNEPRAVLGSMEKMMRRAGQEIIARSRKHSVDLRLATYILAFEKAELLRIRRLPEYAAKIFA